ncbi:MAG TPA: hypothetical protein PLS67_09995, partial [Accumulibacter sp.]|nr:hypothetical protein [Accumulibacter sp.]
TRPLTSNNLYSRTGSLSLATCTKPDVPYDYTGAGAIWAFFFTTTLGFWLVAKKAGLILEAVRKW